MPELPEVETVMRGLAAVLEGRTIRAASVARPDLRWPFPAGLAERLAGARVEGFRRRGKYMLMRLSGRRLGADPSRHVGADGGARGVRTRRLAAAARRPTLHEHMAIETTEGVRVGFVDPRRFGCVDLVPTAEEDRHRLLAGLGPEPLEPGFTPAVLAAALRGRRDAARRRRCSTRRWWRGSATSTSRKRCSAPALSPRRLASSVAGTRAARLVPAIRAVLEESIAAGGSSLRDYVRADGEIGFFQERFKVYDREGLPCEECPGAPDCLGIRRIVQAGRATFHCPRLQR